MSARSRYIELSVGIFILLGVVAFLVLWFNVSGESPIANRQTYQISADFSDVGGLKVRAPVTISGVRIGEVTRIDLKPEELTAHVTMKLQKNQLIPYEDVSARILTEGLLGSNYISIVPGFSDDKSHPFLRQGDAIAKTQEAVILENLIGQLLFNINKKT